MKPTVSKSYLPYVQVRDTIWHCQGKACCWCSRRIITSCHVAGHRVHVNNQTILYTFQRHSNNQVPPEAACKKIEWFLDWNIDAFTASNDYKINDMKHMARLGKQVAKVNIIDSLKVYYADKNYNQHQLTAENHSSMTDQAVLPEALNRCRCFYPPKITKQNKTKAKRNTLKSIELLLSLYLCISKTPPVW